MPYAFNDDKSKNDLSDVVRSADLATVATSGNYGDLNNRPFIYIERVNLGSYSIGANEVKTFTYNVSGRMSSNDKVIGVILEYNLPEDRASGTSVDYYCYRTTLSRDVLIDIIMDHSSRQHGESGYWYADVIYVPANFMQRV